MEHEKAVEMQSSIKDHLPPRAQTAVDDLTRMSGDLLNWIHSALPDCRETNLAVTRIQEGAMWAAASITQHMS